MPNEPKKVQRRTVAGELCYWEMEHQHRWERETLIDTKDKDEWAGLCN